ncbi:Voltage-gated ClC-type chloride channel ClcB [Chromobacterium violaceum]|uniref:Voltage-gated ClC-type chloride channel ClcB n=1 Tax=Chromobacterium violaceum TaxID=536 RepID=A0A3S4HI88_CHRVL|nr:Voltage-gated ClC-type chloride channel ClcB [Chromobacterium violaceum]
MGAMELGRRAMGRLPLRLPWRMALGGAVVGGLAWFWPQMWGNGYSTVSWLLVSDPAWQLVLTLLACKLVATSATSGSGAVGASSRPCCSPARPAARWPGKC